MSHRAGSARRQTAELKSDKFSVQDHMEQSAKFNSHQISRPYGTSLLVSNKKGRAESIACGCTQTLSTTKRVKLVDHLITTCVCYWEANIKRWTYVTDGPYALSNVELQFTTNLIYQYTELYIST